MHAAIILSFKILATQTEARMKTTRDSFIHNEYALSGTEDLFTQISKKLSANSDSSKVSKPRYNTQIRSLYKTNFFDAIINNNLNQLKDHCIELYKHTTKSEFEEIRQHGIILANDNNFNALTECLMNGTRVLIVNKRLTLEQMKEVDDCKTYFIIVDHPSKTSNDSILKAQLVFKKNDGICQTLFVERDSIENKAFLNIVEIFWFREVYDANNHNRPVQSVLYRGKKLDSNLCKILEPHDADLRGLTPAFRVMNYDMMLIKQNILYAYTHNNLDLVKRYLKANPELEKFANTKIYNQIALDYIHLLAAQTGYVEIINAIQNNILTAMQHIPTINPYKLFQPQQNNIPVESPAKPHADQTPEPENDSEESWERYLV